MRVPAAPVTNHLHALTTAGWTRRSIALTTGLGVATIHRLHDGRHDRVHHHTAAVILALDPDTGITHHGVDEAVILRILDGHPMPANNAERREVVRRWLAAGRPLRHLTVLTGWRSERYLDDHESEVA